MKIAVDVDGTLVVWPRVLSELMRLVIDAGGSAVLLTGTSVADPDSINRDAVTTARIAQVRSVPGTQTVQDVPVIVCIGRNSTEVSVQKGRYCKDNSIDLFIDDSTDYCRAVVAASPNTLTLLVNE